MNIRAITDIYKHVDHSADAATSVFHSLKTVMLFGVFISLIIVLLLYKVILFTSGTTFYSFWTAYGVIVSLFLISRIPYAYLYSDDHSATYPATAYPSVSVIVAAKNEEAGIFRTVETCINSHYPAMLECIVIDDGSTDKTATEIKRAQLANSDQHIKFISFPENKGKKEAMAAGISAAQNDVIVFVDSDSFVEPNAIRHIAEHFIVDKNIGAVSGNTKVENRFENLMTRMQSIQYAVSFDIYKAAESVHHSVTCCPGCFSAYRREAISPLIEAWKEQRFLGIKGTFGDDRSLTNFVLRNWGVIYCEGAKATTTVPNRFSVYWKQQLRWKKSWIREGILGGLFMWKGRNPLASLGFYIHFTFPFLGPILALFVLAYSVNAGNPLIFLIFMLGFMTIGLIFSLFVHLHRGAENFYIMPLFSILFVTVLIWQMPYAMLTVRKVHWGTR